MSNQDLHDRVFLVTGASSGIGRAVAWALADRGGRLALAARNAQDLQETVDGVCARGGEALAIPTDVTDPTQVERLVHAAVARWGKIDVLISGAGQYIRAPALAATVADLERSMAVNFYGHVHMVQAVLPAMVQRGNGYIVLVATVDAKKGLPLDIPYVSAKFALSGYGEVLRQELSPLGVAVTTVFPGRVDTPMISDLRVPWISAKISPEAVAHAIVRALRTRPAEIILPPQAALLHLVNVVSPRLADWFVRVLRLEGWQA